MSGAGRVGVGGVLDVDTEVTLVAAGLVGAGVTMLLAPRFVGRVWFGVGEPEPATRALVRALGARDLGFGVGIALAQRGEHSLRAWLGAAAMVGAVDGVVSLLAWRHLPWSGRALGVGLSAVAAGRIAALSRAVD